jgi:hypothetical protein
MTQQPQTTTPTVCAGVNVNISMAVSGTAVRVTWMKDGQPITPGGASSTGISGTADGIDVVTQTLTIFGAQPHHSGRYSVRAVNECGGTIDSQDVLITVNAAPPFVNVATSSATNLIGACPGGTEVMTASVPVAGATTYRWQRVQGAGWTDLVDDAHHSGTGTATLTLSNIDQSVVNEQMYRVLATGICGPTVESGALFIGFAPLLRFSPPPTQNFCPGATAQIFSDAVGPGRTDVSVAEGDDSAQRRRTLLRNVDGRAGHRSCHRGRRWLL